MPAAVRLRVKYSAGELRALAKRSKDAHQSRRLLSLAAIRDGMDRGEAAKIGGMDRQTLRDWVHRFNAAGPDGLFDNWTSGPTPRLSPDQLADLATIVETGPDRKVDGVVRWRRIDLKHHERYVGKLLKKLSFSHISARLATPRKTSGSSRLSKNHRGPRPACGVRNGCGSFGLEGSSRWNSGGDDPVKKRGGTGCCALESGDAFAAIPVRKLISLRGPAPPPREEELRGEIKARSNGTSVFIRSSRRRSNRHWLTDACGGCSTDRDKTFT